MGYTKQKEELKNLLLMGYPLIYIVTEDERPVTAAIKEIVAEIKQERKYSFYTWDVVDKAFDELDSTTILQVRREEDAIIKEKYSYIDLIKYMNKSKANMISVFNDFPSIIEHSNFKPQTIRRLKQFFLDKALPFTADFTADKHNFDDPNFFKHIIITSPNKTIPKGLEKLFQVVDFGFPQREEVCEILTSFTKEHNITLTPEESDKIISASLGLTETQIFYAYKQSVLLHDGHLVPKSIYSSKKELVKQEKALEFIETDIKLEDAGGFDHLIDWMKRRKLLFNETTRAELDLDTPNGMLLTGVQGCGKSFVAKGVSNFLELPLIRLNYSSVMGRYIGESQENMRKALSLIEAVSPCVLWIDEIEKSIPSDGVQTHQTNMDVFGQFITWMQEKTKPVFIVATANNVDHLPAELLRKGRFDEIFFVDLPNENERADILSLHMTNRHLDTNLFDLQNLARETKGFSGAEIEQLIKEVVLEAVFLDSPVTNELFVQEIKKTNPLSITMKDKVKEIRKWAVEKDVRRVSSSESDFDTSTIGF